MAFPERLLGAEEHVVVSVRPHVKVLLGPVAVLLACAAVGGFAAGALPWDGAARQAVVWGAIGVLALVVLRWSLWPFLRWLATSYTVTSERLVTRSGVLSRRGREVPLGRIHDVAYEQTLPDRLFRAGTLVLSTAGEQGQVVLTDVPGVHQVQRRLGELVRAHDEPADEDLDADRGVREERYEEPGRR